MVPSEKFVGLTRNELIKIKGMAERNEGGIVKMQAYGKGGLAKKQKSVIEKNS